MPDESNSEVLAALGRIECLLVELLDAQPRLAYSASQAGRQLGDLSDRSVSRLVGRGVIAKVPHMGARLVIPHAELVRLVESASSSSLGLVS